MDWLTVAQSGTPLDVWREGAERRSTQESTGPISFTLTSGDIHAYLTAFVSGRCDFAFAVDLIPELLVSGTINGRTMTDHEAEFPILLKAMSSGSSFLPDSFTAPKQLDLSRSKGAIKALAKMKGPIEAVKKSLLAAGSRGLSPKALRDLDPRAVQAATEGDGPLGFWQSYTEDRLVHHQHWREWTIDGSIPYRWLEYKGGFDEARWREALGWLLAVVVNYPGSSLVSALSSLAIAMCETDFNALHRRPFSKGSRSSIGTTSRRSWLTLFKLVWYEHLRLTRALSTASRGGSMMMTRRC